MWYANENAQYAIIGSRSCRSVSEMPGTIDGLGVRVYDGRAGRPEVVALAIVLVISTMDTSEEDVVEHV